MEKIEGIILALISSFFIFESLNLHNNKGWALSPALFPLIVSSLTLVFSLVLIFQARKDKAEKEGKSMGNMKLVFLIVFISIIYLLVLPWIHFLSASIIYLFSFLWILGERKYKTLALISIVTPVFLQYVFGTLLGVFLP